MTARARFAAPRAMAAVAALAAIGALAGCGASPGAPQRTHAQASAATRAARPAGPARYLVASGLAGWIERSPEGVDRLVADGRRIEARGSEPIAFGPVEPEVDAGFAMPPWAAPPGAPAAYLFWKGRELYASASFTGELRRVATLPAEVSGAFEWLDGVGLRLRTGTVVVRPDAGRPSPFPVAAAALAVAVDARRALALTALGHALVTADGGQSFRDATSEIGDAAGAFVRGQDLVVTLAGGRERAGGAAGRADAGGAAGRRRGERPPDDGDRWPAGAGAGALEAAVTDGVALPDGTALAASGPIVARVDLSRAGALSATTLPEASGDCSPIRTQDALLVVCASRERALVLDAEGPLRVERAFDVAGAELDRFVGTDGEALGFIGPCDGAAPVHAPADAVSGASPRPGSTEDSPVFCARAARGSWIEHRLEPADAADVIAWAPRPGGGAIALVARSGAIVADDERFEARGDLRILRVAREQPPLALPRYASASPVVLSRALRATGDGGLEGFLPSSTPPAGLASVRIDDRGRVRVMPGPPRVSALAHSGAFALASTEDGKLFESVDRGGTWREVAPPPGAPFARPTSCTSVGCRIGGFVRLGWDGEAAARSGAADPSAERAVLERALREQRGYRRSTTPPAILEIGCRFTGKAEGSHLSDSYGFGVTPQPLGRGMQPARLGLLGAMHVPYAGGALVPQQGDVEVGWIAPFDLDARVRRASVPLGRAGLGGGRRFYEVRLGWVVDGDGHVEPIPLGPGETCPAALLEAAGVTRPLGGCWPDPTLGAALPDGRTLFVHSPFDGHVISILDAPKHGGLAAPRELRKIGTAAAGARAHTFGVGLRGGLPVVVAVDGGGAAVLAPVDPERGTLGAEEALASLAGAALATDPRCAGAAAGEARVVIAFDSEIGLVPGSLPGVSPMGTTSLAVVRWSPVRACVEAVELSARDERYEPEMGSYEQPGALRKVIARFDAPVSRGEPGGPGVLVLVTHGAEVRQRLRCDRVGGLGARAADRPSPEGDR